MFKKIILAIAFVAIAVSGGFAQEQKCGTDEHYWKLLQKYPQLAEFQKQFDEQIDRKIAERTSSLTNDTATYDIPIVIHVIHDYGIEDLADTLLYDAAAYWTVVYMKQNADTSGVIAPFVPYIGKPNMRLHLATIDPNGKPTKGIVRFQSYLTAKGDDEAKYGQWPPNEYVNVWFIGTFNPATLDGVAAYAYFPSSAVYEPYYDGIICLASYANYAKTVPHEMGHVLNLYHPWGSTNSPAVECGDDDVDDTPPTKGHEPVGCVASALYDTACATGYMKEYTSSDGSMDSLVNYPDTVNAQNIMDYTYCQEMFTKGQVQRMRAAIVNATAGRSNLITAANLAATGALAPMPDLPPVSDFTVSKCAGCTDARSYFLTAGNPINFVFQNFSWNDTVSDVLWAFSNGAATSSSTSIDVVDNSFSLPGWVTVSLVANSNAGSDTLTNTHTVYVADTVAVGGVGYTQNFTSASAIANWPMFNFYNNDFKWQFYTGAGMGDNSCLRYHSFDTSARLTGSAVGDHDDIYTPGFNFTDVSGELYVNFFTSGAYTHNGLYPGTTYVNDSIEIDASTDGGAIWRKLGGFGGASLADNGSYGTEYVPNSATTWVARSVNVPSNYYSANTFFRFRYRPGNTGNDLYIDNFSLDAFPTSIKQVMATTADAFTIFPNPSTDGCTLLFKTGNDGLVSYSIKDVTGKIVYEAQKLFAANSTQQQALSRSATPAAGMYFVTLTTGGVSTTQKMVVY